MPVYLLFTTSLGVDLKRRGGWGGGVLMVHIKASNINCIVGMRIVRAVRLSGCHSSVLEHWRLKLLNPTSFSLSLFSPRDIKQVSACLTCR